jgi:hypothetical protein
MAVSPYEGSCQCGEVTYEVDVGNAMYFPVDPGSAARRFATQ